MAFQITAQNRTDLQFMNDCVRQNNVIDNLSNELSRGNGISQHEIELLEWQMRRLGQVFISNSPFVKHIFDCTTNKVNELFKKYTVLIEVHYPNINPSGLSLRGVNGDWVTDHQLRDHSNRDIWVIRVPKPLRQEQCFEFKLIEKSARYIPIWQPGENLKIYASNKIFKIKIIGEFSNLNSYSIQTVEVGDEQRHNHHTNNQFSSAPVRGENNNNNNNNQPQISSQESGPTAINFVDFLNNDFPIRNNNSNEPSGSSPSEQGVLGTVPYRANNIPTTVRERASEIERLRERFDDLENPPNAREEFNCPITQEIMPLPVFDSAHPGATEENKPRHHLDASSFENLFVSQNSNHVECPTCRRDERRDNLLIDTQLQIKILNYLKDILKI